MRDDGVKEESVFLNKVTGHRSVEDAQVGGVIISDLGTKYQTGAEQRRMIEHRARMRVFLTSKKQALRATSSRVVTSGQPQTVFEIIYMPSVHS
jgi:hypothetical protein